MAAIFSAMVLLLLVSCVFAMNPLRAFSELGVFFGLFLLIIVLNNEFYEMSQGYRQQVFYGFFVVLAAVYSVTLFFNFLYVVAVAEPGRKPWVNFPNFPNPRLFNHLQAIFLPILWGALFRSFRAKFYLLASLILLVNFIWMVAVFYSGGRGVLLALLLAGFVVCAKHMMFIRGFLVFCLAMLVCWKINSLMIVKLPGDGDYYIDRVITTGSNGRFDLWGQTVGLILDNPLLGLGPQHFTTAELGFGSPHNTILLWLVELGLPAAVIIILAASILGVKWLKSRSWDSVDSICRNWSLLAVVIYSMFTGNILSPLSQLLIAVLLAAVLSDSKVVLGLERPPNIPKKTLHSGVWVMFFVVLVDIVLFSNSITRGAFRK